MAASSFFVLAVMLAKLEPLFAEKIWDFTKANTVMGSIEEWLREEPGSESLVPLLHDAKRHLVDFEKSARNGIHLKVALKSPTEMKPSIRGQIFPPEVYGEVETLDQFKGSKVVQISDDTEGRLGNWTVLKAMEKLLEFLPSNVTAAERICRPGPLHWSTKYYSSRTKKCLILGDSISIGYHATVSNLLGDDCEVHHSPWGGDGGSLDTRYILQCIRLFLSSSVYAPVQYDAIVFNAGLHDVDCCNYSEYVPVKEYVKNLREIKDILLKTGARVAFVTSTPIPFNRTLNNRVVKYNRAAKRAMKKDKPVKVLDLYKQVTDSCGGGSFKNLKNCCIFQNQPNVHFSEDGYFDLASEVIRGFKTLLKHSKPRKKKVKVPKNDVTTSPMYCIRKIGGERQSIHGLTGCPANTTCCINEYSNSFIGCCMLKNAMDCGDSWHCCPKGTVCDPSCTGMKCSCRKAPWESKASRTTFSLMMKSLNEFWKKIVKKYPPLYPSRNRELENPRRRPSRKRERHKTKGTQ